jgi:hypothetical protein
MNLFKLPQELLAFRLFLPPGRNRGKGELENLSVCDVHALSLDLFPELVRVAKGHSAHASVENLLQQVREFIHEHGSFYG